MNSDFCVAVHALVYLDHKGCVLSSEALAENICTNPARVRKVLSRLRAAGLVETHEGSEGGYRFAADARQVTLAQVARALDTHFVTINWHSGSPDLPCLVASGMAGIMDDLLSDLDEQCMRRLEQWTTAQIVGHIFGSDSGTPERKEHSHEKV